MKKLNLGADDLKFATSAVPVKPRLQRVATGFGTATMVTPPLDARAKRDGFNVIYHLDDLNLPRSTVAFSPMTECSRTARDRPEIHAARPKPFICRENPEKAKPRRQKFRSKTRVRQSAYDAYAKR